AGAAAAADELAAQGDDYPRACLTSTLERMVGGGREALAAAARASSEGARQFAAADVRHAPARYQAAATAGHEAGSPLELAARLELARCDDSLGDALSALAQ